MGNGSGQGLQGLLERPAVRVLRQVAAGRQDVAVTLHDAEGVVLWASVSGVAAILGGTRIEPPYAASILDIMHDEDVVLVRHALGEVAAGGTAEFGFRARHADGHWIRLRTVAWPLDPSDEEVAVIAVSVPAGEE